MCFGSSNLFFTYLGCSYNKIVGWNFELKMFENSGSEKISLRSSNVFFVYLGCSNNKTVGWNFQLKIFEIFDSSGSPVFHEQPKKMKNKFEDRKHKGPNR